jgi:hypothetical protein
MTTLYPCDVSERKTFLPSGAEGVFINVSAGLYKHPYMRTQRELGWMAFVQSAYEPAASWRGLGAITGSKMCRKKKGETVLYLSN